MHENRFFGENFNRLSIRERTVPNILRSATQLHGDRLFADLPKMPPLTFADVERRVSRAAGGFAELGVRAGDRVAVLSENRAELVLTLWSQGWLGSIGVPVNPAHRGATLAHILNDCGAQVVVTERDRLPVIARLRADLTHLRTIVVLPEDVDGPLACAGFEAVAWDTVAEHEPIEPAAVAFSDPYMIMYTSGTTGPSKGAVVSHHYYYCWGAPLVDQLGWTPESHLYTPLPLYHAGALNAVLLPALLAGARVTIRERFSASRFWQDITEVGATHVQVIGTIANILARQAPSEYDRAHNLVTFWVGPPPADPDAFAKRFGVELLWQGFGMTEAYPNQMVRADKHPDKPINCIGRPTPLFDLEILDDDDLPVPADGHSVGEISVRPKLPYSMMTEYWNNPEATALRMRNFFFHTGDLGTMDEEGYICLWGRKDDAIRRRGENVSAFELEREVMSHPDVEMAAAYGVPGDLGEDDIKVDIVVAKGSALHPEQLVDYLRTRVADFMLPRYVQIRTTFPMTGSQRIEKYKLRAEGTGHADLDRGSGGARATAPHTASAATTSRV